MVMVNVEKEKDWDEWRKFNGKLQIGDKKRKKSLSRMTVVTNKFIYVNYWP